MTQSSSYPLSFFLHKGGMELFWQAILFVHTWKAVFGVLFSFVFGEMHPLSFPLSLEYYRAFFTLARTSSPNSDNAISAWYSSYAATHTHPFESPLSSPFLACQVCRSAEAATSKANTAHSLRTDDSCSEKRNW